MCIRCTKTSLNTSYKYYKLALTITATPRSHGRFHSTAGTFTVGGCCTWGQRHRRGKWGRGRRNRHTRGTERRRKSQTLLDDGIRRGGDGTVRLRGRVLLTASSTRKERTPNRSDWPRCASSSSSSSSRQSRRLLGGRDSGHRRETASVRSAAGDCDVLIQRREEIQGGEDRLADSLRHPTASNFLRSRNRVVGPVVQPVPNKTALENVHKLGELPRLHLASPNSQDESGEWSADVGSDMTLNVVNTEPFRDIGGTWVNCYGDLSPWETMISAEENYSHPRVSYSAHSATSWSPAAASATWWLSVLEPSESVGVRRASVPTSRPVTLRKRHYSGLLVSGRCREGGVLPRCGHGRPD